MNIQEQKILVTSYANPDIDGTACAFAYAEYLNKTGANAIAGLFGDPHREAQFVLDKFNIQINKIDSIPSGYENIILVDASDLVALPSVIKPEQVIEIIDHRKINEIEKFIKAKIQIEQVGACATLVAEKFRQNNIVISKKAAFLLYPAIVSNTINFQGKLTTERDKDLAEWLVKQIDLPVDFIHEMFVAKSKITKSLEEVLLEDFKTFEFGDKKIGIAQFEITDTSKYIKNNLSEIIKILEKMKQQKLLDHIFLNGIDLEGKGNTFVSAHKDTINLLESILKIKFNDNLAVANRIIMRKEITPLMKEFIEKS